MAHESFEDPATADLMNRLFVNIKVDREERPDIDRIYQTAHYLLTRRSGGWPLTMFLTPDKVPFFGGTYFPREPRHGLPAFTELMQRIVGFCRTPGRDPQSEPSCCRPCNRSTAALAAGILSPLPLDAPPAAAEQSFDERHGGFGQA
jgi:uncharacterized protein YyaL (SSP411 family)